ncbi:ferritin-like domain-containing protein [Clostridium ganghwense]|uniref:Ferritin-like domain-containing protein n=1 Tax=Clostridium ganghwense TaxID=312089 RepID=A0ABT4CPB3_9CLOT|nr:ferritin-like domain-containing protein [Clostridium ganghwense]MCY6370788.1 ferritin-like domain-containing protein [Clostridium ganghwense]
MNVSLTQKETMLLQDQKSHEELCIEKYTEYANKASDPQLKQIFTSNANQEKQHLDSINQLLNGQLPDLNAQGGQQANNQPMEQNQNMQEAGMSAASDVQMCEDILMTEKYVSSAYDTSIFEFRDTNIRDVLNHIQKEEQKHGESVYQYMESKGMYNPQ